MANKAIPKGKIADLLRVWLAGSATDAGLAGRFEVVVMFDQERESKSSLGGGASGVVPISGLPIDASLKGAIERVIESGGNGFVHFWLERSK